MLHGRLVRKGQRFRMQAYGDGRRVVVVGSRDRQMWQIEGAAARTQAIRFKILIDKAQMVVEIGSGIVVYRVTQGRPLYSVGVERSALQSR